MLSALRCFEKIKKIKKLKSWNHLDIILTWSQKRKIKT